MSKKLNRKKSIVLFILILLLLIGLLLFIFYYFFGSNLKKNERGGGRITNPAAGLSFEEAVEKFDESFVLYLLASIEAYKLHNPVFSSDNPKIEFYIDDEIYNAEIIDGEINVERGEIEGEDIIIRTTKEEGVRMIFDSDYIDDSFREGKSSVELIAGKLELAGKGYLGIYDKLSG